MKDFFPVEDVYDISDSFTLSPASAITHREAARALACCINETGRVDLYRMAEASGLSLRELTDTLKGILFQDPEEYDWNPSDANGWLLRSQYISGNIKEKLEAAREMNRRYAGRFSSNIKALESALPEQIPFEDIGISIGSQWVPADCYSQFAKEVLELNAAPPIFYSATLGQWKVKIPDSARYAIHNVYTFGTGRISALKSLEHTLNATTIKIYDEVSRPDRESGFARILNKDATLAVQEKQEALQQAFRSWIGKDPHRVRRLEEIYYSTYACHAAGRYDGSFLTLPELNPDFTTYPHQKNAVARIILEQDVLLNHAVGSGKTNILIMGIHERRRMGLSEKAVMVVPNNVLEAFERAHRYLYPNDKILVIRPNREFSPANRQATLKRIRDEDFVAVYMAFSSFEMIPMSRRYKLDRKAEEIRSFRAKAAAASDAWEKKALESAAARLCRDLAKMEQELPEDKYLPFDSLGITTLVVDEVHNFKNISLKTRADGVVGLHTAGSSKCNELMEKTRYLRRNGGSLLFSTGTPLTNSISDLFVLQLFLQPEQLELLHLKHFDDWIGSFATRQTGFEIDVDSRNYRVMTRFSSFHNLPELTALFAGVCDFYNGEEKDFGLPECGDYIDTVVPRSQEQSDYIDELVYRTELIRQKLVESHEDNLLQVTHDGRAAALDIRLADPSWQPDPRSTKAYACALNVRRCWQEFPGTAQLVFCDLGTPKKGFNIYDTLKDHLKELGIPAEQIAFIHDAPTDAKRRKLFEAVNKAQIRVLIGSTAKLGVGINVQENLIAIHHLDVPWKPSDMVQREGRLIRQGNCCPRVYRYRYITAGTFDAYSWQIVENKQRFIGQFMSGALADRNTRDIDDTVLTYAEIKALSVGDPLLKQRIETGNQLERLKISSRQRDADLRQMQNIISGSPGQLDALAKINRRILQDRICFAAKRERLNRQERLAFGEDLLEALAENVRLAAERCFDHLHGFAVLLPADMDPEKPRVILSGANRYEVDMTDAKAPGCIQRIEHILLHLEDRSRTVGAQTAQVEAAVRQAQAELKKGNPYTHQISVLREKLLEIDQELNRRAEHWAA